MGDTISYLLNIELVLKVALTGGEAPPDMQMYALKQWEKVSLA